MISVLSHNHRRFDKSQSENTTNDIESIITALSNSSSSAEYETNINKNYLYRHHDDTQRHFLIIVVLLLH